MTTAIARSSCGSRPLMTSLGVCSTSMSGATPSFSTTQPSSAVQMARFGAVVVPVPHRPIRDVAPAQQVDVVVGDLAAAVETLVHDDRVLVRLREEVPFE